MTGLKRTTVSAFAHLYCELIDKNTDKQKFKMICTVYIYSIEKTVSIIIKQYIYVN